MIHGNACLGDVRNEPYDFFASRAIRLAEGLPLVALSLDQDGLVWAETLQEAHEGDLIGVYEPIPGVLPAIREDLRHEAIQRGLRKPPVPPYGRKPVMGRCQTFAPDSR